MAARPAVVIRVTGKSGISQARVRLGVKPLRELHDERVKPIAGKTTKGAWYRRWRLVSFDGRRRRNHAGERSARRLALGEFAHLQPLGDAPAAGFCLFVHPAFQERADALPLLIAYHIVRINYGEIATHVEAELFGATLLGLEVEDYYETLCALADSIPAD